MTDTVAPAKRSWIMRQVRSTNTAPEMFVRSLAHRLGYRYRLHRRDLPGTPDLVFPSRRKVVFVHGCFWHGHTCTRGKRLPKANADYWRTKIARNQARDEDSRGRLLDLGWESLVLWECQLQANGALERSLISFLGQPTAASAAPPAT